MTVSLADGTLVDAAAGTTRYDGGPAVTPSDLFQIGSNTKAFTGILGLKLQSAGKLNIHERLGRWLPQYPVWKSIALDRLINMTSGTKSARY